MGTLDRGSELKYAEFAILEDAMVAAANNGQERTVGTLLKAGFFSWQLPWCSQHQSTYTKVLKAAMWSLNPRIVRAIVRAIGDGPVKVQALYDPLVRLLTHDRPSEAEKMEVLGILRPLVPSGDWISMGLPDRSLIDYAIQRNDGCIAEALVDMGASPELKLPADAGAWVDCRHAGDGEQYALSQVQTRLGYERYSGARERRFALMMDLLGTRGLWTTHCTHTTVLARQLITMNANRELTLLLREDKESVCPDRVLNCLMVRALAARNVAAALELVGMPRAGHFPRETLEAEVRLLGAIVCPEAKRAVDKIKECGARSARWSPFRSAWVGAVAKAGMVPTGPSSATSGGMAPKAARR